MGSPSRTWCPTTTSTTTPTVRTTTTGRATTARGTTASRALPTTRRSTLRELQKRNILTMLLLSQGVPMIAHGDELGRTQGGNNNVYCQNNELSWIDWERAREHEVQTDFTARVTKLRS